MINIILVFLLFSKMVRERRESEREIDRKNGRTRITTKCGGEKVQLNEKIGSFAVF